MRSAVPLFKSIQKKVDRINLIFREGLTGVRVIRAFRQEKREQDCFKKANEDYPQVGIKAYTLISIMMPIMTLVLSLTNVGIIMIGANLIANKTMEVGNLIALMTYASQILFSFMQLTMLFVVIPRVSASAARINAVLHTKPSITDPEKSETKTFAADAPVSLNFDKVTFKYKNAENSFFLLQNLSKIVN